VLLQCCYGVVTLLLPSGIPLSTTASSFFSSITSLVPVQWGHLTVMVMVMVMVMVV
jgi:hypothetical protein